jgi:hypothetical protein
VAVTAATAAAPLPRTWRTAQQSHARHIQSCGVGVKLDAAARGPTKGYYQWVDIDAPNPDAILAKLQTYGGLLIGNGGCRCAC